MFSYYKLFGQSEGKFWFSKRRDVLLWRSTAFFFFIKICRTILSKANLKLDDFNFKFKNEIYTVKTFEPSLIALVLFSQRSENNLKSISKQEVFRERRHLHVCDL